MMAVTDDRDQDRPVPARTKVLGLLLGIAVLSCFSAALGVIGAVLFDPDIRHPVNWKTWLFFAVFLGAGAVALWGLVQIKPWANLGEPVSQTTRKTNALFAWSGLAAVPGMPVRQADKLVTGEDGAVGVTFLDNSLLSAGPRSVLGIDRYSFDTTTHAGQFDASLQKGSLAVVSGKIVKQQPGAMRVRTPASVMGVRGTEFLVRVDEPAR